MLPYLCPGCQSQLKVKSLSCKQCGTEVTGLYELPALVCLSQDDQTFILNFVKCSGSLKDMAKHLGLSYPTVRNLLDEIIKKITNHEKQMEMGL
jgi:hypothetical protein